MEWLNDAVEQRMVIGPKSVEQLLVVLSVMAPCMAAELLEVLLSKKLSACRWPTFDPILAQEDEVTIVVQVNSKVRANILVARDADQQTVESIAKTAVAKWLEGKRVVKVIFVANRLINFVIQ